jgi:hypothetical protein
MTALFVLLLAAPIRVICTMKFVVAPGPMASEPRSCGMARREANRTERSPPER